MMRFHATLAILFSLPAAMCVACGGAADAGAEATSDAAPEASTDSDAALPSEAATDASCEVPSWLTEFITTYGRRTCEGFAGCCTSAGMSFDAESCVSSWVAVYLPIVQQSACSKLTFDPAEAQSCYDALTSYAQSCDKNSPLYYDIDKACERAVYGEVPAGGACNTSLECQRPQLGHAYCVHQSSTDSDGGTTSKSYCQHAIPVGEGAPCTDEASDETTLRLCDSVAGYWCDTKGSGTCKAPGNPGDPCPMSAGGPGCVDTAWCNMGKCEALSQPGESCESLDCNPKKAQCDPSTKTCVALAKPGEACQQKWDCESSECSNGKCAPKNDVLGWFGVPGSCTP